MCELSEIRIRDPFVFVENGTYYLLGTTGNDCWNAGSDLTLYASDDLKKFQKIGHMVDNNVLAGYTQIWAPELHKVGKKYYLIVSVFRIEEGRGSMIFVSDCLREKFQPLTGEYVTPKGWDCLDATLFTWKGRHYLFFSNEWLNPVTEDGDGSLYVAEISSDLRRLVGNPKKIVSGKNCGFAVEIESKGRRGHVAEGPYVVEEGDRIVLYWSTIASNGYCVARSVANDIFGEYVFDRIVFSENGGHAMVFEDLGGVKKIVLHQPNRSPLERMRIYDLF